VAPHKRWSNRQPWNLIYKLVAGWGGLGKGCFEITGLEYVFWKIGNNGIELETEELK
jgi:hypothetical protein